MNMLYFQEHKWKMYMELDDESDGNDDSNDADVLTCIKDVVFTCDNHGSFKLTHVRTTFLGFIFHAQAPPTCPISRAGSGMCR